MSEFNGDDVGKNVGAGSSGPAGPGMRACARNPAFRRRAFHAFVAACLVGCAALCGPQAAQARTSGLGAPVAYADLPAQARQTEKLILAGGPFPYSRDGVVFMNREGRLDRKPRGYYHEYTVPTPGAHDRGARRIICGGPRLTEPDACFFTQDHYNSFHQILN